MKKEWIIVGCLLLITVVIRLPYYFIDVIDWDESTFILMGQSLVNGHLPYLELWDNKPPLTFVFYAGAIALFGKSIIAIRVAGTLCVFATSSLVYLIGKQLRNYRIGFLAASLFIILSALISSGQATMSEHVALPTLVGALALLTLRKPTLFVLFVAGILLTIATFVRLNLAYVVVIVGFWLVIGKFKFKTPSWLGIAAYSLGSLGTILTTYLPYLATGNGSIWLNSVILAPLSYTDELKTAGKSLSVSELPIELILVSLLIWAIGLLGIWITFKSWNATSSIERQNLLLVLVFFWATEISIIQSGATYQHYFIQISPFLALVAVYCWDSFIANRKRLLSIIIISLLLAFPFKVMVARYQVIGDRLITEKPLPYGVGYEIADYITPRNPAQEPIYLMNDQIVYWLLDLKPISKSVTHPSNIVREHMLKYIAGVKTSTEAELRQILAKTPKFIVKKPNVSYLQENTAAKSFLDQTLAIEYKMVDTIGDREIYQIN